MDVSTRWTALLRVDNSCFILVGEGRGGVTPFRPFSIYEAERREMTEYLQSITRYPVPRATIDEIAGRRGDSKELGRADLLVWLSNQPNVSQGGQSYSFNAEERKAMRAEARAIYRRYDDPLLETVKEVEYGYKGEWL